MVKDLRFTRGTAVLNDTVKIAQMKHDELSSGKEIKVL